jgi:hypothetical protein
MPSAERQARTEQRRGFDVPIRLTLIEGDADRLEDKVDGGLVRLEAKVDDGLAGIRALMIKTVFVLAGLLVSVTTAAILFATRTGSGTGTP